MKICVILFKLDQSKNLVFKLDRFCFPSMKVRSAILIFMSVVYNNIENLFSGEASLHSDATLAECRDSVVTPDTALPSCVFGGSLITGLVQLLR